MLTWQLLKSVISTIYGWTQRLLFSVSLSCPFLVLAVVSNFQESIWNASSTDTGDVPSVIYFRGPSVFISDIPFPRLCDIVFFYKCSAKIQQYLVIKQTPIRALQCAPGTVQFDSSPRNGWGLRSGRVAQFFHCWQWHFLFSGFPDHKISSAQHARLPAGEVAHVWDDR